MSRLRALQERCPGRCRQRSCLECLSANYLVKALNDTIDLLFGGARQPPPNPFHGERPDLADPDPGSLRQARGVTLEREREASAGFLTGQATAMTVPERSLNTSWLRTRTGRSPACSRPRTGLRSAQRISPLSIRAKSPSFPPGLPQPGPSRPRGRALRTPAPSACAAPAPASRRVRSQWPDSCYGTLAGQRVHRRDQVAEHRG